MVSVFLAEKSEIAITQNDSIGCCQLPSPANFLMPSYNSSYFLPGCLKSYVIAKNLMSSILYI